MSEQNQNNDQQLNSTESQGIPSVVGKKTNKSTKKAGFMLLLIALLLGAGFCLFAINKEDKGDIATTDVDDKLKGNLTASQELTTVKIPSRNEERARRDAELLAKRQEAEQKGVPIALDETVATPSMATRQYDENGKPSRLDAVVLSTQHGEEVTQEQIHADIKKYVFDEVLPKDMVDANTKYFINPTGRFVIGGPNGDSGLTGRKIIVDTYGGYARHGGGAFSGKDCTKVDRSAAYAARYVAKNIVAAGLADRCEIQLSYAIGVARPTSIMVDTFGTGKLSDERLVEIIRENFDLRPAGIIKMLDLRRPIYKQTAAYGHFGRTDIELPWEKVDVAEKLAAYL